MFVNLHRHDHNSAYDGFGKPHDAAKHASRLGQKALALTNHGNVVGVIDHYYACKENGIKPILGVEAYFTPSLAKDPKPKETYHLILLVKNMEGYHNLMQLISKANRDGFYYKPIMDPKMLEEHSSGLICMTACGSGYIPKLLVEGRNKMVVKAVSRFRKIFGDDFYLEVMAHNMMDQSVVNELIIELSRRTGVPVALTTDSHYTTADDYDTQKIMVRLKNPDFSGYPDAFMPSEKQVCEIWKKNHGHLGKPDSYIQTTEEIADKCDLEIDFGNLIPTLGKDGTKKLKKVAMKNLKAMGKWNKRYETRLTKELKVIDEKGYSDYFLLCYDIINFAKKEGIAMDFGRGSVGGSVLALALGISMVDPLIHKTLFERFLRPHRTTLPDIDMDFDARRRHEIIEYIYNKYQDGSAQISSCGKWQVKNTIGDLCKLYGYDDSIKEKLVSRIFDIIGPESEEVDYKELIQDKFINKIEYMSGGMIKHFSKLYGQTSYFGTHASGVAIVNGDLKDYVALMKSHGGLVTSYDKNILDKLNILKMDILGLETATILNIAETMAGVQFSDDMLNDKKTINAFKRAETDGIFQFEGRGGKSVLLKVQPDHFSEVVACSAMNRPAPLKLGVVDNYVAGKNGELRKTPWWKYTKDTHGQIIYQEQVMIICRKVAGMDWADIDKVLKDLKQTSNKELKKKFIKGAKAKGWDADTAGTLYENMTQYLYNRAHGTAYTLVSWYAMWLMQHYPLEYIFAILSREKIQPKIRKYESLAVSKGIVVLLPHVNGTADYSIQDLDGEKAIQAGLSSIKGVGQKTAEEIMKHGPYTCEDHVEQRVPKRIFNSKVRTALTEVGALEFNRDLYEKRVVRYNATLANEYLWSQESE